MSSSTTSATSFEFHRGEGKGSTIEFVPLSLLLSLDIANNRLLHVSVVSRRKSNNPGARSRKRRMEGVACLNLSAQKDGRSLTPSVSDLRNFSNEEFTTIDIVLIVAAFRAQWQDIPLE